MNNIWYELEIMPLGANDATPTLYKTEFDRSDTNAGFDVYSSEDVTVSQTQEFIPFGAVFRLLKVDALVD